MLVSGQAKRSTSAVSRCCGYHKRVRLIYGLAFSMLVISAIQLKSVVNLPAVMRVSGDAFAAVSSSQSVAERIIAQLSEGPASDGGCPVDIAESDLRLQHRFDQRTVVEASSTSMQSNTVRLPEFNDPAHGLIGGVTVFRRAFVSGAYSVVWDCASEYFSGGCSFDNHHQFPRPSRESVSGAIMVGDVVLVGQHFGKDFYHWFVEGFFRLALLHEYLLEHPNVKILHYELAGSAAFFEMIGIDPERHILYDPSQMYFADTLLVPTATPCSQAMAPATRFMQKIMHQAIRTRYPSALRKEGTHTIVVQERKMGSHRRISNHDKLVSSIREVFPGAAVYEFKEDDPPWTAARIHYLADLIIGPHGAGFSNLVFARRGVAMIEIHPYIGSGEVGFSRLNLCHEKTAMGAGVRVARMIATSGHHTTSYNADIEAVIEAARALLGDRRFQNSTAAASTASIADSYNADLN